MNRESKFNMEEMLISIETSLEKVNYLVEELIKHYGLDDDAPKSKTDALYFALSRPCIGMGLDIIRDYVKEANNKVDEIRKAVGV